MASNPHAAAEGGRVGVTRHQRSIDSFQDAVQVGINIAVPKAKHAKAGKCQRLVVFFVFGGMSVQIMLTAVDLYNKSVFHTDEVEKCIPCVALGGGNGTHVYARREGDSR